MKKYIATILFFSLMLGSVIMGIAKGTSRAQPQVNTVDLILHYKMWDGLHTSSTIFDYAFENDEGTLAGNVTPTYPGLLFDEGVINANSGPIDNMWDGGGTISVWLKPEGQGADDVGRVFDKSNNALVGWYLYCPESDEELRFVVIADVCDGAWDFPIDITGNKWQHVVIVYSSDARLNNPVVYVDGVSVIVTRIRTWTLDDPAVLRKSDVGKDMYLGSRAAGGKYWDGSMDDVMMFTRSLKVDEARSIYESTRWRYSK